MQRLKNEERKYEFIKTKIQRDKIFGDLINYIKYIYEYLWKNPYLVSEILSNADINDIKKCLAHFFTVNLYENILSNRNKEDQLLIIIALQLKKEIEQSFVNNSNNDINNLYKTFLNQTPVSFIFDELFYKKEILYFFKPIIIDLIKELESVYPSQEMEFNPILIRDSILLERDKAKKEGKVYEENIEIFRKSIFKKDKNLEEKVKLFSEKYKFGIFKEELEKISKSIEDKNMINYINEKILNCSNNPFIYYFYFLYL